MRLSRCYSLAALFALSLGVAPRSRADTAHYIPARAYQETALKEIDAARASIDLFLYAFAYRDSQPAGAPARLAQALVRAQARGVKVSVVLNRPAEPGKDGTDNAQAAAFLVRAGVPVFFVDDPLLHAKALVIDRKTVLLGSSNWSASAFQDNAEANVLLRSPAVAAALLKELSALTRRPAPAPPPAEFTVPFSFLTGPLAPLIRANDHRAFDAYMYLCFRSLTFPSSSLEGDGRARGAFEVDVQSLSRALSLSGPTENADRRQIHKVLKRLQDKYHLLTLTQRHGKPPEVHLLPPPTASAAGPAATPAVHAPAPDETPAVPMPHGYFAHGWHRRLPFSAKVFLLISQAEASSSPFSPRWSENQRTLSRRYGGSVSFLQQGVTALRRAHLLAVEYAPLDKDARAPRRPNVYELLPFYDPAVLQARFHRLEGEHGPPALARARRAAALVYADSDADAVEKLILLEKKAGPAALKRALRIIGAKNPDNPKRSPAYLIGTIESLAREREKLSDL